MRVDAKSSFFADVGGRVEVGYSRERFPWKVSSFNSAARVLRMINNTYLFSPVAKPTKVGGLHGCHAGHLVNIKGIMEVTVGRGVRKAQCRMSADGSRQI